MQEKPHIRIACWNMRGFASSIPYLRSLCNRADVIAISEHWLHDNKLRLLEEVSDKFLYCAQASRFSPSENYGTKRGQGGVAILWRKSLGGVSQISDNIHDRMCGIRVQTKNGLVINIISIYLPSQGSPESFSVCIDDLSELVNTREYGSKTIICGDANADMGHLGGVRGKKEPTRRGKDLYEFLNDFNLEAVNMQDVCTGPIEIYFGPVGSTTIDYILIPTELTENVKSCRVLAEEVLNCSDNNPVVMEIDFGNLLPTTSSIKTNNLPRWNKTLLGGY